MGIGEIIREIILAALAAGCLVMTVGLLILTAGLREFQDQFKLRDVGNYLFKHFF